MVLSLVLSTIRNGEEERNNLVSTVKGLYSDPAPKVGLESYVCPCFTAKAVKQQVPNYYRNLHLEHSLAYN